MINSFVVVFSA